MQNQCWWEYIWVSNVEDTYSPPVYIEQDPYDCNVDNSWPWCEQEGGNNSGGGDSTETIEEKIDGSNLDPCSEDILEKLKNLSQSDINQILEKFGTNDNYNIILKTAPLPKGNTNPAATIRDSNFNYTIFISPNYEDKTQLFIAGLIVHETVHAFFMSIVDDYNSYPYNNQNAYDINNFGSLFQAFCDKSYPLAQGEAQNIHHLEMANKYVDAIARSLQEFQTGTYVPYTQLPQQVYVDLAWGGLNGTPVFNATYPIGNPNRNRILNRTISEQIGTGYQGESVIGIPCN